MQKPPSMAHPFLDYARDHNIDMYTSDDAIKGEASGVSVIRTPGRFSFMEIPTEIRLKIYNLLLLSEESIEIPLSALSSVTEAPVQLFKPCIALLQTCKKVDEEASHILYGKNTFTISLGISSNLATLLSKLRWSTLRSIPSIKFITNGPFHRPNPLTGNTLPAPYFECSGNDILARFKESDLRYSPQGPDQYMGLHVATWISTAVTKAELNALQRDLELMMAEEGDEEELP